MASSSINTWWVETNSAFLQRMADRRAPFIHQHQHIDSAQVIRENNDPHVVVCEANTRLLLLCPNMIGHVKSAVKSVTPHQNFNFFLFFWHFSLYWIERGRKTGKEREEDMQQRVGLKPRPLHAAHSCWAPTELIWHPFYMKLYEKANMATLECKGCIIKIEINLSKIQTESTSTFGYCLISIRSSIGHNFVFCAILSNFGPFLISSFFCLFLT